MRRKRRQKHQKGRVGPTGGGENKSRQGANTKGGGGRKRGFFSLTKHPREQDPTKDKLKKQLRKEDAAGAANKTPTKNAKNTMLGTGGMLLGAAGGALGSWSLQPVSLLKDIGAVSLLVGFTFLHVRRRYYLPARALFGFVARSIPSTMPTGRQVVHGTAGVAKSQSKAPVGAPARTTSGIQPLPPKCSAATVFGAGVVAFAGAFAWGFYKPAFTTKGGADKAWQTRLFPKFQ